MTVVAGRTDPAPVPAAAPAGAPTSAPTRPARSRVLLWVGAVVGMVVLVALVGAFTTPRTTSGDLEPTSAAPAGARAVAQILERQGVEVRPVSRSTDVASRATTSTTTVVVQPQRLGPDQLDRLASAPGTLVLVAPDLVTLDRLAPFAQVAGRSAARAADPDCAFPAAVAAGRARAGGNLYRIADGAAAAAPVLCYPERDPDSESAAGTSAGSARSSLVVGTVNGRTVVVIGQADILRNAHLAGPDGTAALALRLLGTSDQLIWYVPSPAELATSSAPPTLSDLIPAGTSFVAGQLVLAALLAMLWRGRRLGRLVTEPLPVTVRAAETQEGRARLYRRARAHGRAAATLRTAALRRLAARFDAPSDATPQTVVTLVTEATGQPAAALAATFLGPEPRDDRGLVRLADELAAAEAAVASSGGVRAQPPGPGLPPAHHPAPHPALHPNQPPAVPPGVRPDATPDAHPAPSPERSPDHA